jgi:hypothetical protein
MVFSKGIKVGRAKTATVGERNWTFSNIHRKKSQLVQPISPYDELPVMQELAGQLMPSTKPTTTKVSEYRESDRKDTNKKDAPEERQPPAIHVSDIEPYHVLPSYNSAHYVPSTIDIPVKPAQSEDSELTWNNNVGRGLDDTVVRSPRRLTPHPSFEDEEMTAIDFHYLYEAGMKADSELWPSDEDTVSKTKVQAKSKTWSSKSMHIWKLDGDEDGAMEDSSLSRRKRMIKIRSKKKGKAFAMI